MTSATAKSQQQPIVFVVDDDISVRESLESLIAFAGWQPETFASAGEFLARPRSTLPSCLVLDVSLPDLVGLELQKLSRPNGPTCPSSSSPDTAGPVIPAGHSYGGAVITEAGTNPKVVGFVYIIIFVTVRDNKVISLPVSEMRDV